MSDDQGQGRPISDLTGGGSGSTDTGGSGEQGPPLIPIAAGDVVSVAASSGKRVYSYRDRNGLPPTAPVKDSTGWHRTVYRMTVEITLAPGDRLPVLGASAVGIDPSLEAASGPDANLGVWGSIGPLRSSLEDDEPGVVMVWTASGAAGPQTGSSWVVAAPANSVIITTKQVRETVPPPPGQPGQAGGPGDYDRSLTLPSNAGDLLTIGGAGIISLVVVIAFAWWWFKGRGQS